MGKAQRVWYGIIVLTLVPVVLWFMAPTFLPRFSGGVEGVSTDLSRLLALIGTSMFAINLILSARIPFLIRGLRGLHVLYEKHGKLGRYGFYLLLLHPILLIPQYAGWDFSSIVHFIFSIEPISRLWGKLALLTFVVLIALTIYFRPKYHIWRWTHRFMGLAFFLASLHVYFIPSDVAAYAPLRWYMLILSGLGLLAYLYHTLLGRWLIHRYTYVVTHVENLRDMVTHLVLRPQEKEMHFLPGQFIFISFRDAQVSGEVHPFSITADPQASELSLHIKRSGDFTNGLHRLALGATAEIEGPYGTFSHQLAQAKEQVWIAGGIGITPFLSMAQALVHEQGYSIDLLYCTRSSADAVLAQDLESLSKSTHEQLRVQMWCSEEKGLVTGAQIQQLLSSLEGRDIFICAPPPMIRALRKQLRALGIENSRIHSEEFSY
ncbi:MAG: ferredoxin reductase family protein [Candidatus Nomurabacteria bacterium]|nr:MAG: ferredoxin reductase family protein [Candidatus Nomurabacteria bacterium]